jgi:hypothetical protein
MNRSAAFLLVTFLFVPGPFIFAQNSDQPAPDSGVLVSGGDSGGQETGSLSQENPSSSDDQAQNKSDAPTDPIIIKATSALMFQITANMKLSQDQINTIQPIIMKYIIKIRDLQQSLESGKIDGKTMYDQREQLYKDEDRELSLILTPAEMNLWANIQIQ